MTQQAEHRPVRGLDDGLEVRDAVARRLAEEHTEQPAADPAAPQRVDGDPELAVAVVEQRVPRLADER